jgi:HK97 family phage portal protein
MASLIGKAIRNQGSPGLPVPLGASGYAALPGTGSSRGNRDVAFLQAYCKQGTVYANAGLLASGTAGPRWNLYRQDKQDGRQRYTTSDKGSDQRVQVVQHPALALLNAPGQLTVNGQKMTFFSRFRLFEVSQLYMELTGKSHWVIDRVGTMPVGIWPVRPDRMTPVPDSKTYLKGWIYDSPDGTERIPLQPQDVIFNCFPDPENLFGGTGWVEPVLAEIEGARYAAEWNRNFFSNSARPDGVIQTDKRLSDEEWDELTARWRETHRGVARAHRVAVLEAGATWVATSTSPKDMDFANLLSTGADRIREGAGMHKVMTGVTEDVNRANAQTGEEVFASWKISPRLDRWWDVLNTQYLPMFGTVGAGVEFDYVYPAPVNREQDNLELTAKATAASLLIGAGLVSSDVLTAVGLPPMKDAPKPPPSGLPPGTPGAGGMGAPAAVPGESGQGGDAENTLRDLRVRAGWDSPAWDELDRMRQQAVWNMAGAR